MTCVTLVIACGARTGAEIGPEPSNDSGFHEPCKSSDGVRLCGGACPPIPPPECPGYGCTPAYDWSSKASPLGVCWSDRTDKSARPCGACAKNEVCVSRNKGELVCTSRAVCDALAELGGASLCRYTDLTPYDGRPFATGASQCLGSWGTLCGGECGFCEGSGYCTGRSSTRAFGLCNDPIGTQDLPPMYQDCAAGTWAQFERGNAPEDLVRKYGVCLLQQDCLAVGKLVGVGCYVGGLRVGP